MNNTNNIDNTNTNNDNIYIGTSGYDYDWDIYNDRKNKFKYYTDHYKTVEINATFYHDFSEKAWRNLKERTPKKFIYSIKVPRSVTHYYQYDKYPIFEDKLHIMKSNAKVVLFQYSDRFICNEKNMERLQNLNTKYRAAFEFRHHSWFEKDNYEKVLQLFRTKNNKNKMWSIVVSYMIDRFIPNLIDYQITSDFLYIRMHGTKGKYIGSHEKIMPELIRFINQYKSKVKYIFIYFNNTDASNNGIPDAIYDADYLIKQFNLHH